MNTPAPGTVIAGQAATSTTSIYTVAAGKALVGLRLWLFHASATEQTVNVHVHDRTTSGQIRRLVMPQNESAAIDLPPLSAGQQVFLHTTTGSVLNYFLSGTLVGVS